MSDEKVWPKAPEIDEALIDFHALPQIKRTASIGNGLSETALLPVGYEWRKGVTSADLQLWKVDVTPNVLITSYNIGEMDINGSLTTALHTIYLEKAHSISTNGQAVVTKNIESGVSFSPVWTSSSPGGVVVTQPSSEIQGDLITNHEPNGSLMTNGSVDAEFPANIQSNVTFYATYYVCAESYTGPLSLVVRDSRDEIVYQQDVPSTTYNAGSGVSLPDIFYRVRTGDTRIIGVYKPDGTPLQVRPGAIDQSRPYRRYSMRPFSDRTVVTLDATGKINASLLPPIDSIDHIPVANQAARYALGAASKFRIVLQIDTSAQYYIDKDLDTSDPANWIFAGSTAASVINFNGRPGAVVPQPADYPPEFIGAVRSPLNDGSRRVFIGDTPTLETIIDSLTSTSKTSPLSANQGRVLKELIDAIVHTRMGYDLVPSTAPRGVLRDTFLTSGLNTTQIAAANVPWVFAGIDDAERSLPFWIQKISTFFKNLENDTQFDQLIGGIPQNFAIPLGAWGVSPNAGSDMDNAIGSSTTYGTEYFELIVGRNVASTEIYTFGFNIAQFSPATYDAGQVPNPFRILYQTVRGGNLTPSQTMTGISLAFPRCTARTTPLLCSSINTAAFPVMFEPIAIEINK